MSIAIITGSAGLIGAEAARFFTDKGLDIVGIDNDMRRLFFGDDGSTQWSRATLESDLPRYRHVDMVSMRR
jgi:CDP-paratose 2-epimerase